jgi:DNA-binding response OmpR family regulator
MEAASSSPELLRIGDLEIRPREGLALAEGRALTLSVREFELLLALARSPGRIVAREELYHTVWGRPLRRGDRSCDVYVHKLRVKLEEAVPATTYIHTHIGFGYRLDPAPASHRFHTNATGR